MAQSTAGVSTIGTYPGATGSPATHISRDGSTVIGTSDRDYAPGSSLAGEFVAEVPFVSIGGVATALPLPVVDQPGGVAIDLDRDGTVIVGTTNGWDRR